MNLEEIEALVQEHILACEHLSTQKRAEEIEATLLSCTVPLVTEIRQLRTALEQSQAECGTIKASRDKIAYEYEWLRRQVHIFNHVTELEFKMVDKDKAELEAQKEQG